MTAHTITLEPYMKDVAHPGAFRALLWKEFRELLRPGLTALAIVGVPLLLSSSFDRSTAGFTFYAEASGGTPSLFTLTSAVAALLIGWSQIRRENRGDQWALLVHRPVPRPAIFWSKVVAGGVVYLLAAGIPMLLAGAWEATPGHRPAPFDLRLMLPNTADLLCGLVYYAAALLSTMREARWFASRALPVGAALICSLLVIATPSFGVALLVCAAGVLVVGIPARSTFVAGGFYEPQPVPARALLGVSVSLGLIIVGVLPLTLISAFLLIGRTSLPRMARVAVASDGELVRIVTTFLPFDHHSEEVATDLTGRPADSDMTGLVSTPAVPLHPDPRHGGYRSPSTVFVPVASILGRPSATSWYFVRRERAIAVYDNVTSLRIGWIGPDGYSPGDAPPANRFDGDLRPLPPYGFSRSLIALPSAVYRLDRNSRAIQRIFMSAMGEEILGAGRTSDSSPVEVDSARQFDAIVTSRRVHVQALDGTAELDLPLDPSSARYGTVKVVRATQAAGTPTFAWYSARGGPLPDAVIDTAKDQITKYDSAGVTLSHVAVRAFSALGPEQPTQWAEIVVRRFLEPIAVPGWDWLRRRQTSGESPVPVERHSPVVAWIASLVGAIVFAIIAWLVARRYAFPTARQWWWTFVGFVGGALGVLLMLSLIEWPARVACPVCGKARVVTRERCEHCGAPFSAPARDGTEIFEAATV